MKTATTLILASISLSAAPLTGAPIPPPAPPRALPPRSPAPAAETGVKPALPQPATKPGTPPAPSALTTPPPTPPPGRAIANAGPHSVPLEGLPPDQSTAFIEGKAIFLETETPADGLGPLFNDVSCVACHFEGGAGGGSRTPVTRFGRVINGIHDPLEHLGGPLLQKRATRQILREVIPVEANTVAQRITTPLFGAGLLEAISDESLRERAASPKPDGIAGRAAEILDPVSGTKRVGRFGWKSQHATLDGFAADAYLNEMGITSAFFPVENAPNGKTELLAGEDQTVDPEDVAPAGGKPDFAHTAEFMRLLAPVRRATLAGTAAAAALNGERIFAEIGCIHCHTPSLLTGKSPVAALSEKKVNAYSDLLLHDMGSLGDGLAQGDAGLRDMRTAPLWGLRLRSRYLHDGRASTLELAVTAHDGEAKVSKDRFMKLSRANREALLSFLRSL